MIKLILTDMDGTLLDDAGNLPAGFDAMVAELRRRGVLFGAASGRQYEALITSFPKYKDEFLFVSENGTNVVYRGEHIYTCPMDRAAAQRMFGEIYAADPGIFCVCSTTEGAYVLRDQFHGANAAELDKYYTHASAVDRIEDVTADCLKVAFFDATGHSADRILPLTKAYQEPYQVVLSSDYWLDIMDKHISKGVAVRAMEERFGFAPDEVAVFGDYLNDLQMMSAATYSFAMANAHPDIKAAARYETTSNEDAGVLKGIQRLIDEGLC